MATSLLDYPMAKRADVPVKMDSEVVRKAKIVAAFRGQTLAEFLSDTVGSIVDDLMRQEIERETSGKPANPPRGRATK